VNVGDTSNIFAIDPGPKQSAWILYDGNSVRDCDIEPNDSLLARITTASADAFAIEWIESFGMAVGKDVFETVYWIGRFDEVVRPHKAMARVPRREVKLSLCNSVRAKDTNIRQAMIDIFPATGGGKTPQVGTKSQPGPLYGVKSHIWSALAVAVTYQRRLIHEGLTTQG